MASITRINAPHTAPINEAAVPRRIYRFCVAITPNIENNPNTTKLWINQTELKKRLIYLLLPFSLLYQKTKNLALRQNRVMAIDNSSHEHGERQKQNRALAEGLQRIPSAQRANIPDTG